MILIAINPDSHVRCRSREIYMKTILLLITLFCACNLAISSPLEVKLEANIEQHRDSTKKLDGHNSNTGLIFQYHNNRHHLTLNPKFLHLMNKTEKSQSRLNEIVYKYNVDRIIEFNDSTYLNGEMLFVQEMSRDARSQVYGNSVLGLNMIRTLSDRFTLVSSIKYEKKVRKTSKEGLTNDYQALLTGGAYSITDRMSLSALLRYENIRKIDSDSEQGFHLIPSIAYSFPDDISVALETTLKPYRGKNTDGLQLHSNWHKELLLNLVLVAKLF